MKPSAVRSVEELRNARRYNLVGGVRAELNSFEARIDDVSDGGLRIEHPQAVKIGAEVLVRLTIVEVSETATWYATVVWSRMSSSAGPNGKFQYLSGLRFDPTVEIAGFLGRAIRANGKAQTDSLQRKREKFEARLHAQHVAANVPTVDQLRAEHFRRVERAWRILMADPLEAGKWYLRAKFTPAELTRTVSGLAYRDDVLATWEYLQREISIDEVAAAIGRLRGLH